MKDQHKQCKLAAIFVIVIKPMHYPQCLFRYRYVFNAEFILYRYWVNVDCIIFTLCSY